MELIHKALDFQVRQVGDPADRVLEFIGSTADVDRYGDIIEVAGWDLRNYQKNPQFLWAHNYSVPPVGTTRKVFKTENALAFHVYFFTDEEINAKGWPANVPTPETVYRLYQVGGLKATSVGFQGQERDPILGKADDQGHRPQTGWRYTKQELYELSAVPVPANPYATIQEAVQKGIISEEQARLFQPAESASSSDLDQRLAELGLEPGADTDKTILALCDLVGGLQERLSNAVRLEVSIPPLTDEQVAQLQTTWGQAQIKAGAVLNAKNKEALAQARELIDQVLAAAEPAAEAGKDAAPQQTIYSLALNPGAEPQGGRPAGESVNLAEILEGTKALHQMICPPAAAA